MSATGLHAVSNPSEMFLSEQQSDSDFLAGLAVAIIMDGSRTFLIEIQVFCVSNQLSAQSKTQILATKKKHFDATLRLFSTNGNQLSFLNLTWFNKTM